jgi:predicted Zn-dependent peptidase
MRFIIAERQGSPVGAVHVLIKAGIGQAPAGSADLVRLMERAPLQGSQTIGTLDWAKEKAALLEVDQAVRNLDAARARGSHADPVELRRLDFHVKLAYEQAARLAHANIAAAVLERNGFVARFDSSADFLDYSMIGPADRLAVPLKLFAEWFRAPVFRFLDQELSVVRANQRGNATEDIGQRLLTALCREAALGGPYAKMGETATDSPVFRQQMEAFFKSWVTPGNTIISLVGPIQPAQARRWAEEYFGKLTGTSPDQPPPASAPKPEPTPDGRRIEEKVPNAEALGIAWKRPPIADADDPALEVISAILTMPSLGRLHQALSGDLQLAQRIHVFASYPGRVYPNLLAVLVMPVANRTDEVEAALDRVIGSLREEPVGGRELSAAKSWLRLQALKRMEAPGGMAAELARFEAETGDATGLIAAQSAISRVTAEDVQRVARRYLATGNRIVVSFVTPGRPVR